MSKKRATGRTAWARYRAASAPDTEYPETIDEPEQKNSRQEEPSLRVVDSYTLDRYAHIWRH